MSAEVLRRAAALMRERAEGAAPGPWVFDSNDCCILSEPLISKSANAGDDSCWVLHRPGGAVENQRHIASWHPAVALAVADLLEDEADTLMPDSIADQIRLGATPEDAAAMAEILHHPAIAVARAYLGESA